MQGAYAGTSMKGGGTWSVADGVLTYSAGANTGTSKLSLSGSRLVIDPDPVVVEDGSTPGVSEYERSTARPEKVPTEQQEK